jgi:hypothetical protein
LNGKGVGNRQVAFSPARLEIYKWRFYTIYTLQYDVELVRKSEELELIILGIRNYESIVKKYS